MAFIDDENSAHGNLPYEGYVFTLGSTVLYFTNQPVGTELDGVHFYNPAPGLQRRRLVRRTAGTSGGELEIKMSRTTLADYIPGYPPNPFGIVITRYQPTGNQTIFRGDVVNTRIEGRDLLLRCQNKMEMRMGKRAPGLAILPQCPLTLYDEWCRVDRSLNEFPVDIVSVDGLTVVVSTNSGRADGYFAGGEMLWSGERRTITTHVGTTLTIDFPFNTALEVGEEVITHPGCDKQFSTCDTKFINKDNFQGARFMPDQNVHILGIDGMRVSVS